jgi:lysozyme
MKMPTPIVIDLSHWNTIPSNLKATAAAGIVGVIHKATEGTSYKDDKCDAREFLTRDAGMLFGLYHFLRAGMSIQSQINNFMSVYKRYDTTNLLVALDYEKGSDGKTPSLTEVQNWLLGVEGATGKKPVIYSGNSLKEALGGKVHPVLNQDNYPLWLAQYSSTYKLPPGWSTPWLWQYTQSGSIPGVQPPVDLNAGDITSVVTFWGGAAPVPPEGVLDFSDAMRRILDGEKMRRRGWNGKGMWIAYHVPVGDISLPFIYMFTVTGDTVPWLASQTDMLASDWEVAV